MFGGNYFGQPYFGGAPAYVVTVPVPPCPYGGFGALYFGQYPTCPGSAPTPPMPPCPYGGFGAIYFGQYPTCHGISPIPPPSPDAGGASDKRRKKREHRPFMYDDAEEAEIVGVLTMWLEHY